jgi:hypothetical protein
MDFRQTIICAASDDINSYIRLRRVGDGLSALPALQ